MTHEQALDVLKTGVNVFVTGAAGSGKTHLVNQYIDFLNKEGVDVGITASTGIAATHMGGVTIHSWAGIGIKDSLSDYDLEALTEKQYLYKRFERAKVLILDEVSMLHHFRLDLVDKVARTLRRNDEPFGGMQVVLCGDFFQLPPVVRYGETPAQFAYHAKSWKEAGFRVCYLSGQFRQRSDDPCLTVLDEIRSGDVSDSSRELLKERHNVRTIKGIEPTRIFTHNMDVDALNDKELDAIKEGVTEYVMETRGKDNLVETLAKSCLAPRALRLKPGARVMCVKNDFEAGYANGSLGVVQSCGPGRDPIIKLASGKSVTMPLASWSIEEDGRVLAELVQYPLRLAWAITVHKSQGMSLDAVEVDLSRSFEPGMGYVALSRVRSLDGLTILGFSESALAVHEDALSFDRYARQASTEVEGWIEELGRDGVEKMQEEFLNKARPAKKEPKQASHDVTAEFVAQKMSLDAIAKERGLTVETIIDHVGKLIMDDPDIDVSYIKVTVPKAKFAKISEVIEELVEDTGEARLGSVKSKLGASATFRDIKLVRALMGYGDR